MSWLYSIVIAGLIFSSNGDVQESTTQPPQAQPAAATIVQGDEREKFEQSYPLTPNGRVSVSNVNGSIVVESWDRAEVKLEATKIADTKEALADVELRIDSRADSFSVEADYNSWRRGGDKGWKNKGRLEVQFKLSVPRGAVLDEIETVNGSVTVSNFTNITKVSAVNGNVSASNLRGSAYLETVNGEVLADFDRLETGSRISLETVNGKVNLVLPSDVNVMLRADTLNGDIKNDFGLPVRKGKYVGRDLYGKIGSGDVQVKLESVNGPLTIQRRNDGKSVNPVVDLLPQKGKDDDWDNEDDSSLSRGSEKVNKEIARAVKDSARAGADAARIAQEQLVKLAPEIEKIKLESLDKIKLNEKEIEQKVKEGLDKQREAFERFRNINWPRERYIEKKVNSFPVKGKPKVTVDAKRCAVRVKSWDRQEVKYVLTELDERNTRSATVTETASDNAVALKVVDNGRASRDMVFNGNSDAVRIEVFVPRNSDLKIVSNGEIRIDGVSGDVELAGVDESIDVRNASGKLRVSAADAQVRVIGFSGDFESRTEAGNVYLEGDFYSLKGTSGEGSFLITVPEGHSADISSNVDAITVENLPPPQAVKEGHWRFGRGGPKYSFTVTEGEVRFRNASTLSSKQ